MMARLALLAVVSVATALGVELWIVRRGPSLADVERLRARIGASSVGFDSIFGASPDRGIDEPR